MDDAFVKSLLNIGLSEKESKIYLALLELGESPITDIAAHAGLKRGIAYVVVEDLMKRGYISEIPGKKVRHFIAVDPSKFVQHLQTNLEDLKFILPALRALQKHGTEKPKIEIFEGKDGVSSVYQMYMQGKMARYVQNLKRIKDFASYEVEQWIRGIAASKVAPLGQKILEMDTPESKEYAKIIQKRAGHEVKLLPKDVTFEMDFAIVDDKLGITSFDPLYIVLIHSESIAKSAAALFDLAWKQGRPILK